MPLFFVLLLLFGLLFFLLFLGTLVWRDIGGFPLPGKNRFKTSTLRFRFAFDFFVNVVVVYIVIALQQPLFPLLQVTFRRIDWLLELGHKLFREYEFFQLFLSFNIAPDGHLPITYCDDFRS